MNPEEDLEQLRENVREFRSAVGNFGQNKSVENLYDILACWFKLSLAVQDR